MHVVDCIIQYLRVPINDRAKISVQRHCGAGCRHLHQRPFHSAACALLVNRAGPIDNVNARIGHELSEMDVGQMFLTRPDPNRPIFVSTPLTVVENMVIYCRVRTNRNRSFQATVFFLSFFLIWSDTRSLRMPALRLASQAGTMRNPWRGLA